MNTLQPVYEAVGAILSEQRAELDESLAELSAKLEQVSLEFTESLARAGTTHGETAQELRDKIKTVEQQLAVLSSVNKEVAALRDTVTALPDHTDELLQVYEQLKQYDQHLETIRSLFEQHSSERQDAEALLNRAMDRIEADVTVSISSLVEHISSLTNAPVEAASALRKELVDYVDTKTAGYHDTLTALLSRERASEKYAQIRDEFDDAVAALAKAREDGDKDVEARMAHRLADLEASVNELVDAAFDRAVQTTQAALHDAVAGVPVGLQPDALEPVESALATLQNELQGFASGFAEHTDALLHLEETRATNDTVAELLASIEEQLTGKLDKEEIVALHKEVQRYVDDAISKVELLPGEKGEPGVRGEKGEPGSDGQDGVGIRHATWEPDRIYREGTYVSTAFGKIYKALVDTYRKPGVGVKDWERIGAFGFEFKGVVEEGATYEDGDIYVDKGSCFVWWRGKGRMLAKRGSKGDRGDDGRDAPVPVGLRASIRGMALVWSDGTVTEADIEGLTDFIEKAVSTSVDDAKIVIKEDVKSFIDENRAEELQRGVPIDVYRGPHLFNKSYQVGDVVTARKGTWLCHTSAPVNAEFNDKYWVKIAGMGGGGGSIGARPPVASPFNVVALNMQIPAAGAADNDTYFSFEDKLLRIWDAADGAWKFPGLRVDEVADDAAVTAGGGAAGMLRYSQGSQRLFLFDSAQNQWQALGAPAVVPDAVARAALGNVRDGVLLYQQLVTVAGNAPANPVVGQQWYDNVSNTLFTWNGTIWAPPTSGVPLGTIITHASVNPPAGYLLCDGSAIPAGNQFDPLKAMIGANVPDLRDQFIRGSASQAEIDGFNKHQDTTRRPRNDFTVHSSGNTSTSGNHHHTFHSHMHNTDGGWSSSNPEIWTNTVGQLWSHRTAGEQGAHHHSVSIDGHVNGGGDTETAPAHIRLAYHIKAV